MDSVPPLDDCCRKEARASLKRHRAIATCDECDRLLLAYDNDVDYERTVEELAERGVDFTAGEQGDLKIIAKDR